MPLILLEGVSKTYRTYRHPADRLLETLLRRPRHRDLVVLENVSLEIGRGEVLGVIGVNGAGKSTLLKLIAGTLEPTAGRLEVNGKVSALLELGGGFHPEMTGRENVFLGGAVAGLSSAQIAARYEEIGRFAGLQEAMDRPVKTYSSGMAARLAFAVSMAIDPEILILDETLSVGDGAFARRSFDRIIDFKRQGKTLLFCSHSMYQVESIADRVIWVHQGRLEAIGAPASVISAYTEFLSREAGPPSEASAPLMPDVLPSKARILKVAVSVGGDASKQLVLESGCSDLTVRVSFEADPNLPVPSLGLTLTGGNGWAIASASSLDDGLVLVPSSSGLIEVVVTFSRPPLLKGRYWVNVFLLCEKGLHFYESAERVAEIEVTQRSRELGVVSLERKWEVMSSLDVTPSPT